MSILSNRAKSVHSHKRCRNLRNRSACNDSTINSVWINCQDTHIAKTKSNFQESLAYYIKLSNNVPINKTAVSSKSRKYSLYTKNYILRRIHRDIINSKYQESGLSAAQMSFQDIPSKPDKLIEYFRKTQRTANRPSSFADINMNISPLIYKRPVITIRHKVMPSIQSKNSRNGSVAGEPTYIYHLTKSKEPDQAEEMFNFVRGNKNKIALTTSITPKKLESGKCGAANNNFPNIPTKSKRELIFQKINKLYN